MLDFDENPELESQLLKMGLIKGDKSTGVDNDGKSAMVEDDGKSARIKEEGPSYEDLWAVVQDHRPQAPKVHANKDSLAFFLFCFFFRFYFPFSLHLSPIILNNSYTWLTSLLHDLYPRFIPLFYFSFPLPLLHFQSCPSLLSK